jgi:hypothetical protein
MYCHRASASLGKDMACESKNTFFLWQGAYPADVRDWPPGSTDPATQALNLSAGVSNSKFYAAVR